MRSVAIIGGGPAGLAAGLAALDGGASVILIDSARDLGGQYWRSMPRSRRAADEARLHHGWSRFVAARARVESSDDCEVLTSAQVWSIEPVGQADGQTEGRIEPAPGSEQSGVAINLAIGPADGLGQTMRRLTPDAVVLATGAHDRTLPFPGWELPGVFTGGAAQALAKSERVRVGDRVVVAGAGPFLLPVASSIVSAGGGVVGVFEASSTRVAARGWLRPAPWRLTRTAGKFGELAGYAATFARSRIPYRLGMGIVSAHGTDQVDAVTVARLSPGWHP
ncbi:MAG: FAD-dependent oxidoreductase, partial [Humibacter sp.]